MKINFSKYKRIIPMGLLVFMLTIAGLNMMNTEAVESPLKGDSGDTIGAPMQNKYYTVIDENGDVITKEYGEDVIPNTLKSNDYKVTRTLGNNTTEIGSFDTYEEAEKVLNQKKRFRAVGIYDISASANTTGINYGVARLIGYIPSYREVDTDKAGRGGYTHGTSANDAAFISTSSDGSTIRVKQAGVMMDIPASQVEVTPYSADSKVNYYKGTGGIFKHYYYHGAYGEKIDLASNQVGYTPSYLKDDVTYYSYDGHYFYTDYTKMIDDYRKGLDYYVNSINATTPFYNYYQYLSFRTTTTFSAEELDKLITDTKGQDTISKLKGQGQALLNTQNQYGINASLMQGVAINESGWGLSHYSQERNNLFGLGAYDTDTDSAKRFNSVEECLKYFADNTISSGYLWGENYRYRGAHLGDKRSGVNVKYASDPYWGEKAATFSYTHNARNGNKDYEKYEVGIIKAKFINYYKDANTNTKVYDSSASDGSNSNVYNFPVTILETSGGFYKVLSDSTLNDSRTSKSKRSDFNINRDYVYVKSSDVNKRGAIVPAFLRGDVTGDGVIEADDYMAVKLYVLNRKSLSDAEQQRANVDGGSIEASDYMLIKLDVLNRQKLN